MNERVLSIFEDLPLPSGLSSFCLIGETAVRLLPAQRGFDKHYIIKKCEKFTRTQNLEVLKFLIEMNVTICEASDGSRINLDKLSATQIANLKRKVEEVDIPIETEFRID